ncbi:MAG TPA: cytochrome C [Vicinamibacteria bacterium]|nr:cytochrome C [Vicinamibacteria bacterium]
MSRRLVATVALLAAAGLGASLRASDEPGGVRVSLCDGESTITVPGLAPGQVLARDEAQAVAGQMMQVWRRNRGEQRWAAWQAEAGTARAAAAPQAAAPAPAAGDQPTKFTARDQMIWKREEKKWVDEGYKAFHSWKELGGTIGVSCDMCHPDATNTHPETYPKYQMQIKKVSLLRDMINWCIENPMKGKPLPENDPRLRAVEAYILATRKGVAIEPGKH